MYLYNGHRAPGLPVYDPGELPYGLIVSSNADNTALILMLCVNRPYYGTNPSDSTKTGVYNTGRMLVYTCTDTDEAWTFSMDTENPLTANDDDPGGGVLWTLEDILKSDGSVWMAGTQPVPERVSEAWVRSFQEGLALGLTGAPLPYTGTEPAPEADWYLYGTPSESGSVAIAEGDGYVRYNGYALPPLPETAYQYAALGLYYPGGGTHKHMLCYTNLPLREGSFMFSKPEGCVGLSYMYHKDEEEWHLAENWEDGKPFALPTTPIWANYDLMNYAGTAVSVKASDPIPLASADSIGVLYGEFALPKQAVLPEWDKTTYPYATLFKDWNIGDIEARLVVCGSKTTMDETGRYMVFAGHSLSYYYYSDTNEWKLSAFEYDDMDLPENNARWTNHDILNEDGTVYLAASEPATIYQKKE